MKRSMLRAGAGVFARLLQRVLVERLVVGLLTGLSALCRFGRLGLGGRGLLGHTPSISAPCGASSCPVRGAFRHEKGHPCGWPGSTFWSGRRNSNPHGRSPRAPEARASAIPPRPGVVYLSWTANTPRVRNLGRVSPSIFYLRRVPSCPSTMTSSSVPSPVKLPAESSALSSASGNLSRLTTAAFSLPG